MQKVTLSFSMEQMSVLSDALVALPFKVAAPLIDDINKQLRESAEKERGAKKVNDASPP